jgi:hypothetical protein
MTDVVAAGNVAGRLAVGDTGKRLVTLKGGQLRLAAHVDAMRLRPLPDLFAPQLLQQKYSGKSRSARWCESFDLCTKGSSGSTHYLFAGMLGTSVENGDYVGRIDVLGDTPPHVRFVPVGHVNLLGIHWAIVGGESGPKSRPISEDWVDALLSECRDQDVAFFLQAVGRGKQENRWPPLSRKDLGRISR